MEAKYLSDGNRKHIFLDANAMNNSTKIQYYTYMIVFLDFSTNLAFRLSWKPIKLRGLC